MPGQEAEKEEEKEEEEEEEEEEEFLSLPKIAAALQQLLRFGGALEDNNGSECLTTKRQSREREQSYASLVSHWWRVLPASPASPGLPSHNQGIRGGEEAEEEGNVSHKQRRIYLACRRILIRPLCIIVIESKSIAITK